MSLIFAILHGIAAPSENATVAESHSSSKPPYLPALAVTSADLALCICAALALLTIGLLCLNFIYLHEFDATGYFKAANVVDSIRVRVAEHVISHPLYLLLCCVALVVFLYLIRMLRPQATGSKTSPINVITVGLRIAIATVALVLIFPLAVRSQQGRWVNDLSTMTMVQAKGITFARQQLIAQAYLQQRVVSLSPEVKSDLAAFVEVLSNPKSSHKDYLVSLFSECLCSSDTGFEAVLSNTQATPEGGSDEIISLAQNQANARGLSFQDVQSVFEGNASIHETLWSAASRLDDTFGSTVLNEKLQGARYFVVDNFLQKLRDEYARKMGRTSLNGIGNSVNADDWINTDQLKHYIESTKLDGQLWNFGPCKARARDEIRKAEHKP